MGSLTVLFTAVSPVPRTVPNYTQQVLCKYPLHLFSCATHICWAPTGVKCWQNRIERDRVPTLVEKYSCRWMKIKRSRLISECGKLCSEKGWQKYFYSGGQGKFQGRGEVAEMVRKVHSTRCRPGRRRVPGGTNSKCKGPEARKHWISNIFRKLKAFSMAGGRKRQRGKWEVFVGRPL